MAVTQTAHRIVVHGMGGIGKSVLALSVARICEVRRAFPDGIFWITLGRDPSLTVRQSGLAEALGDHPRAFIDVQYGRALLSTVMGDKTCLIILDDVWMAEHIEAFDTLGPRCRMMITTRDSGLLATISAGEHAVSILNDEQALTLLAQWTRQSVDSLPNEALDITRECGNLPLALAMVGAMLKNRATSRWANLLHKLQDAALDKIQAKFLHYQHLTLRRAIRLSIDALDPEVRARYLDFAIFTENTPIPASVMELFWLREGLSQYAAQDILDTLVEKSLLARDVNDRLTLHSLHFDYLRSTATELAARHSRLVDAHMDRCSGAWANCPNDGYFFQRVGYHLTKANREDEWLSMLLDVGWLQAKCASVGVYDVLRDLLGVLTSLPSAHNKRQQLNAILRCIDEHSHSLNNDPTLLLQYAHNDLVWAWDNHTTLGKSVRESARSCRRTWLKRLNPPLVEESPLLRTLIGHKRAIQTVTFSPDGRIIATGSGDGEVRIWDTQTGALKRLLPAHTTSIQAVAFSSDGNSLATGDKSGTVIIWDLLTGCSRITLRGAGEDIKAIRFSLSGDAVVCLTGDTLRLLTLAHGSLVSELKVLHGFGGSLSPDGTLAAVSCSQEVQVWNIQMAKLTQEFRAHEIIIVSIAFSTGGETIATGSWDRTVKLWDLHSGKLRRTLVGDSSGDPNSVRGGFWYVICQISDHAECLALDENVVVGGCSDRNVRVWDAKTGDLLWVVQAEGVKLNAVALSPDGAVIATAGEEGLVKLWNSGWRMKHPREWLQGGFYSLAFSPDGRTVASGGKDKNVQVWDAKTSKLERLLVTHAHRVHCVAFSPDGKTLSSASVDHTIRLCDVRTGKMAALLNDGGNELNCVTFSPDGKAVASGGTDKGVKLWKLSQARTTWLTSVIRGIRRGLHNDVGAQQNSCIVLGGHGESVQSVAFSLDGQLIASGDRGGEIKLWNLENRTLERVLKAHDSWVQTIAFSAREELMATGGFDGKVALWHVRTGELIRTFALNAAVICTAFSQDGEFVASGGFDNVLKLWRVRTGELVACFPCDSTVMSIWFDPARRELRVADAGGSRIGLKTHILEIMSHE